MLGKLMVLVMGVRTTVCITVCWRKTTALAQVLFSPTAWIRALQRQLRSMRLLFLWLQRQLVNMKQIKYSYLTLDNFKFHGLSSIFVVFEFTFFPYLTLVQAFKAGNVTLMMQSPKTNKGWFGCLCCASIILAVAAGQVPQLVNLWILLSYLINLANTIDVLRLVLL